MEHRREADHTRPRAAGGESCRESEPGRRPRSHHRLIEAAERSKQNAEGGDIRGVAQALRELGDLATWMLPVHGLFVPNNNVVSMAVERVPLCQ